MAWTPGARAGYVIIRYKGLEVDEGCDALGRVSPIMPADGARCPGQAGSVLGGGKVGQGLVDLLVI